MAMPHYVKRARDYIHAHAAQPIGLQKLVEYSGCSYRTLQSAFGETFGMSPMVYVRMVRLNGAHNDLLVAEDGDTVAAIARKWGICAYGPFCRDVCAPVWGYSIRNPASAFVMYRRSDAVTLWRLS